MGPYLARLVTYNNIFKITELEEQNSTLNHEAKNLTSHIVNISINRQGKVFEMG